MEHSIFRYSGFAMRKHLRTRGLEPIRSTEYGSRSTEYGVRNSEYGVRNSGSVLRDPFFGIRNSFFGIRNRYFHSVRGSVKDWDGTFGIPDSRCGSTFGLEGSSPFGIRNSSFGIESLRAPEPRGGVASRFAGPFDRCVGVPLLCGRGRFRLEPVLRRMHPGYTRD